MRAARSSGKSCRHWRSLGAWSPPAACDAVTADYLPAMFEFSLPTRATIVPSGPDWLHEIKFDGYRLRLERDPHRMRGLFDVDEVIQVEHNLLMPMHA